ncbi:hypothetical protein LMG33818_002146 [Halomonadaceae bacterium LMG 33818]
MFTMHSYFRPLFSSSRIKSSVAGSLVTLMACLSMTGGLSGCASTHASASSAQSASPQAKASAYSELGMAYLSRGDTSRAYQAFQRSLALNDQEASALHGLALIEQHNGDMARAGEYYDRTLRTLSKSREITDNGSLQEPQVRNNYAALLFEEGKFEQACQQLSRAASDTHYPGRPGILVNLSQCQLKTGNMTGAGNTLDEAERIAPEQPLVLLAQAYLDFYKGNLDASSAKLSQYVHLKGNTHESDALGQALSRARQMSETPASSNQSTNRAQ